MRQILTNVAKKQLNTVVTIGITALHTVTQGYKPSDTKGSQGQDIFGHKTGQVVSIYYVTI